jgi:N-acylneuraminate cytidylyltransferase
VESKVFDEIVVTSNWDKVLSLARKNGIKALRRPEKYCTDASHDCEFVKHALDKFPGFDLFAILRPSSPFRTGKTIRRALEQFDKNADSLRAVGPTRNHPRKSWTVADGYLKAFTEPDVWRFEKTIMQYDMPTQALGDVYCQNGCLHLAWTRTVKRYGNVSGAVIQAFFTKGYEGIDINTPEDLAFAEMLMLAKDMGGKA